MIFQASTGKAVKELIIATLMFRYASSCFSNPNKSWRTISIMSTVCSIPWCSRSTRFTALIIYRIKSIITKATHSIISRVWRTNIILIYPNTLIISINISPFALAALTIPERVWRAKRERNTFSKNPNFRTSANATISCRIILSTILTALRWSRLTNPTTVIIPILTNTFPLNQYFILLTVIGITESSCRISDKPINTNTLAYCWIPLFIRFYTFSCTLICVVFCVSVNTYTHSNSTFPPLIRFRTNINTLIPLITSLSLRTYNNTFIKGITHIIFFTNTPILIWVPYLVVLLTDVNTNSIPISLSSWWAINKDTVEELISLISCLALAPS